MADAQQPIGLIGGIGLTEIRIYAQRPAPDGCCSGCPHVHAIVDEGYFVLEGTGAVEFHDLTNGYRRLALEPGQYVHFPPMVMHRLVSDGALLILGMMGSAGLAERSEARIYFGKQVDADANRFNELVDLPRKLGLEGALRRRDAAVEAYQQLMSLWQNDRSAYFAELRRFFDVHCHAMAQRAEELQQQVRLGPLAWADATLRRIARLPNAASHEVSVQHSRRGGESALGMCGVLRPIVSLDSLAVC